MKRLLFPFVFLLGMLNAQYYPPSGGGGGGAVNSVTATAPITSSGGANPNIAATASATGGSSNLVSRDSNGNSAANNFTSATSPLTCNGVTLPLTAATPRQITTSGGTGTETLTLPNATTLVVGTKFELNNNCTGTVSVNLNSGATLITGGVPPLSRVTLEVLTNGTTDGTWDWHWGLPKAIPVASAQGNSTKVQMSSGTTTTNDCVKYDANGNTIDAGACGLSSAYTTVSFSVTPTFTVTAGTGLQEFQITLTGNVTSSTLTTTNATVGQQVAFKICQDATGSRTFTWPTNVINPGSIPSTANTCGKQIFVYDGTNVVAFSPMVSDGSTPGIQVPTGFLTLPTAPATVATNPFTTKGDIIVSATGGAEARLGIGTDGQVLTARSGATNGIDWEAATGGGVTRLAQTVLGAPANSVTFSAISGSFSSLKLAILASGAATDNIAIQFNGDTATNYSIQTVGASATAASAGQTLATANPVIAGLSSSAFALSVTPIEITIPGYAQTSFMKAGLSTWLDQFTSTTSNLFVQLVGFSWNSTAAITSIKIFTTGGNNFAIGSQFSLYALQ